MDAVEDEIKAGGCLIDWHACDLFPESWIDLVVVLRVDTSTLYDRLTARLVCVHGWGSGVLGQIIQIYLLVDT